MPASTKHRTCTNKKHICWPHHSWPVCITCAHNTFVVASMYFQSTCHAAKMTIKHKTGPCFLQQLICRVGPALDLPQWSDCMPKPKNTTSADEKLSNSVQHQNKAHQKLVKHKVASTQIHHTAWRHLLHSYQKVPLPKSPWQ